MTILVLAGGADQIALIKELKKYGHRIVLIDYFQNPPAKHYADKHIVASTLDIQAVTQIAIDEKADLVTTACTDQALLTVAKVSELLRLPCYISYQTALNVTNKSYMKKVLHDNHIPTAKYTIVESCNDPILKDFAYPLVVKPVDCNSSKGVKKVVGPELLQDALQEALNFSRSHSAVVEEFKEGKELSVDCYVDNGCVKLLSVTISNKIVNTNSFTILQSYYPAITESDENCIKKIAQQIADAFNLKNTPLLIQMIQKEKDFSILEFSARMGGGSKYKFIEVLSGVNIMSAYVDLILGNSVQVNPSKQVNFASMNYIYCNKGTLDRVIKLEELKQKGVIDDFFLYKTKGMKIEKAETSSDRPAGFLITASTHSEMLNKLREADGAIQVLDEYGIDIMKHGLYFNE